MEQNKIKDNKEKENVKKSDETTPIITKIEEKPKETDKTQQHIIKSIKWDKINKSFKMIVYEDIDHFEKDNDWSQFKMPKIVDKFKSS